MPFPYLAGETPDAEKFGESGTYTPVLTASTTNPTLGVDSSATGWWFRVGPTMVFGGAIIVFGTSGTNAGSGTYGISLPTPADTSVLTFGGAIGKQTTFGSCTGTASGTRFSGAIYLPNATTARPTYPDNNVTHNLPAAWVANDGLSIFFAYPIVAGS